MKKKKKKKTIQIIKNQNLQKKMFDEGVPLKGYVAS